jgi:hypothetical protein
MTPVWLSQSSAFPVDKVFKHVRKWPVAKIVAKSSELHTNPIPLRNIYTMSEMDIIRSYSILVEQALDASTSIQQDERLRVSAQTLYGKLLGILELCKIEITWKNIFSTSKLFQRSQTLKHKRRLDNEFETWNSGVSMTATRIGSSSICP